MKINENLDKSVVALTATLVVFLLFVLVYYLPRSSKLAEAKESVQSLQIVRQEVSVLLPEVARTVPTTPIPQPDVRTWVASNALSGLEKKLVANDGYLQGQGAQVKLRRLTPTEAAQFMSSLTRVRLQIERMQLQDSDGDGAWDLEISLKVPQS